MLLSAQNAVPGAPTAASKPDHAPLLAALERTLSIAIHRNGQSAAQ
jgi:hypothetical protein